jgi:uroporphyrinogen decarboxylase
MSWWTGTGPDRVPCDFWGTAELTARLLRDLKCATERELWERLGVDKCIYLAPRHRWAEEGTWHMPSLFSIWGVKTAQVPYMDGLGEYEEAVGFPLADANTAADIDRYPWPSPDDWDFTDYRDRCLSWRGYPIVGVSYEPFYLYCKLRGMEQALQDLLSHQDLLDDIMERMFHVFAALVTRALEAADGLVDFVYVAEDLGTQESLLMSPRAFRRSVKPWLARMIEIAHSYGAKVFHHDDGAIRPLIPDLLDIGIDVLNPVQWRCRGMERESLARDFGPQVVFHGGIDNQQTLPFASPAEVRCQVAENIGLFRHGKGHIVAPCHNIQANTPTENVVAMYDAVQEFGRL